MNKKVFFRNVIIDDFGARYIIRGFYMSNNPAIYKQVTFTY